jgi:hypothetical protein
MPRESHKSKCAPQKSESSESESESSYTSVSSEDVKVFVKHNKHRKSKDSESECKKPRNKCRKDSDSESECKKPKNKCKKNSESDHHSESVSDSDCRKKYCFDDVYKYYKYRLLTDESLMVGGSSSYITAYNNVVQNITTNFPANFNNNDLQYNAEHVRFDAPFCVRESGIYIVFFVGTVEESAQFSIFVNGVLEPNSTTGNNAGAGQIVLRKIIKLQKDDTLVIKNYLSSALSLTGLNNVGGIQVSNNFTLLLMKIAPLPNHEYDKISYSWNPECLSHRKTYLYKKILEKMLNDKELMLKGFNVHGTFYTQLAQVVPTESNIVFDNFLNVNGLSWNGSNPDQIQILEDGVYKVFASANTTTAAQLTFYVNNVPHDPSTQGVNRGAGQLSLRHLLELKKGDVVTVKNHTSSNGSIQIAERSGGFQLNNAAIVTIFKIAPLVRCVITPCKLNEYHRKCYEKFKCFLLHNKCLQIMGSPSYFNYTSTNAQTLNTGDAIFWEVTTLQKDVEHRQATDSLVIHRDGIYDIFADIITAEPAQISVFVNGTPELSTVSGRDSGASRTLLRQFLRLTKGDTVSVRNYESHTPYITTTMNSGGSATGHPVSFMAFMLSGIDDENCLKVKKCK